MILLLCMSSVAGLPGQTAHLHIRFDRPLWEWDGFGVNYVETRHTRDYRVFPQDYGGFSYLEEADRQKVIRMIFGEEGLKPAIVKVFADGFHEPVNDNDDPFRMEMEGFDHTTTTGWILYFCREAEKAVKTWDGELVYLAGLYGPPDWMSKQKCYRGRDLDPAMKLEVAEYIISWAKYLRETEGLQVKYISMHNEGDAYGRWRPDGMDDTAHYSHDFNMWWPSHQIVDFLKIADDILYQNNMLDVKITTGETTTWKLLYDKTYGNIMHQNTAREISLDPEAMSNLGLITSHGFGKQYDPGGVKILREKNPDLHAWTTSYTWGNTDLDIVEDARHLIYDVTCNALIPWAAVHNDYESDKLSPPMTFRVSSNANSPFKTNDGKLEVTKAYYFYKQMTRAGQPGMMVAPVSTSDQAIQAIAFSSGYTTNPDAFVVINKSDRSRPVRIRIAGPEAPGFQMFRTSEEASGNENYEFIGEIKNNQDVLVYHAPARSATTFFAK